MPFTEWLLNISYTSLQLYAREREKNTFSMKRKKILEMVRKVTIIEVKGYGTLE